MASSLFSAQLNYGTGFAEAEVNEVQIRRFFEKCPLEEVSKLSSSLSSLLSSSSSSPAAGFPAVSLSQIKNMAAAHDQFNGLCFYMGVFRRYFLTKNVLANG